jgi:hypothetical protein
MVWSQSSARAARSQTRRASLGVESLEDRTVPSQAGFLFPEPPVLPISAGRVADFAKDAPLSAAMPWQGGAGQFLPSREGSWLLARLGPNSEDRASASSTTYLLLQAHQRLDGFALANDFAPLPTSSWQTSLLTGALGAPGLQGPIAVTLGEGQRESPAFMRMDHLSPPGQLGPTRVFPVENNQYRAFPPVVVALNLKGVTESDQQQNESERHNSPGGGSLGSLAPTRNTSGGVQVADILDNHTAMTGNNLQKWLDGNKANATLDRIVPGGIASGIVNDSRSGLAGLRSEPSPPAIAASVSFYGEAAMARRIADLNAATSLEHAGTTGDYFPQVADLISRVSPYDLSVLNAALGQFLDHLDVGAGQPFQAAFEAGWMPSLVGAVLSTAALGVGHQLFKGPARELPLGRDERSSGLRFRRPFEVVPS